MPTTIPHPAPEIVRQSSVATDTKQLTVSTIRIRRGCYETVVFDDSTDKRHSGWTIGGLVIDQQQRRADTRDEAMEHHREALYAARTEEPKSQRAAAGTPEPGRSWTDRLNEADRKFAADRDFARCSQYWAAARSARNFRTAQQDEADRKLTARIRRLFRGGAR